ncbi:MAG: hypothetical protein Q7S23_00810 [bacterium]|nr:hypothetical protein [bacterium]
MAFPKVIVFGVDGVLLHPLPALFTWPGETLGLDARTRGLVIRSQSFGIATVFVTERTLPYAWRIVATLAPTWTICEYGALVVDRDGQPDAEWLAHLTPWIGMSGQQRDGPLWRFRAQLASDGMITDSTDRLASFRYTSVDGTDPALRALRTIPPGLTYKADATGITFLPATANYVNAVRWLLPDLGCNWPEIAVIGRTDADVALLAEAGHPCTFANAAPAAVKLVAEREGLTAYRTSHDGIHDVLLRLQP